MLPKENRLLRDRDFQKVWNSKKSFYTKSFGFKSLKNEFTFPRVGIIVGSKYSKKATDRNKIKRRLREIIYSEVDKIKPGYDLVIYVLPSARGKKFNEIKEDVLCGLRTLKLTDK